MTSRFLAYDIKGIQSFIFSVPRLKCIIGASSQIAEFDQTFAPGLAKQGIANHIFSGGGRGIYQCGNEDAARQVAQELIKGAHRLGLDIRIGIADEFRVAINEADELYPYCPEQTSGMPCEASGLFPVPENLQADGNKSRVHPIIKARIRLANPDHDFLWKQLFDSIKHELWEIIPSQGLDFECLRNVNPEPTEFDDATIDQMRARAGKASLGGRNRWAVIAMDGNDMGKQFKQLCASATSDLSQQLQLASATLKSVTHRAFHNAILAALRVWIRDRSPNLQECSYDENGRRFLVLPFRPLILGGDDLVILIHSSLAIEFVRTMTREFAALANAEASRILSENGFQPFPATDGQLTISAGVLFCKVSLPLHAAIPYAEALLASAKRKFRIGHSDHMKPTPSAIDWDSVTDSIIDSPAERRERDLFFLDKETSRLVCLSDRPFKLNDKSPRLGHEGFDRVIRLAKQLEELPTSFRSELRNGLNQVWSERMRFLISATKDSANRSIVQSLWEDPTPEWAEKEGRTLESSWRIEKEAGRGATRQFTDLLDAVLLLDESHRMNQELES